MMGYASRDHSGIWQPQNRSQSGEPARISSVCGWAQGLEACARISSWTPLTWPASEPWSRCPPDHALRPLRRFGVVTPGSRADVCSAQANAALETCRADLAAMTSAKDRETQLNFEWRVGPAASFVFRWCRLEMLSHAPCHVRQDYSDKIKAQADAFQAKVSVAALPWGAACHRLAYWTSPLVVPLLAGN